MRLLVPVVVIVVSVLVVVGVLSYLLDKYVSRHERGGGS